MMTTDTCIVISFYDERSSSDLIRLLRQLHARELGQDYVIRVVVNSDKGISLLLPVDLKSVPVDIRENTGFNVGAWHHGWLKNPGYKFYIFLQDECEIIDFGWLRRYKELLSTKHVGLVGESLLVWFSWFRFESDWPEAFRESTGISVRKNIPLGAAPSHLQTLAVGASAECLNATNGFLLGRGKINAVASEVMFSRNCVHRGFKIKQSAWRPFKYINHPQWNTIRDASKGIRWNIIRAAKLLALMRLSKF